jgi:hypothetical protein
MQKLFISFFLSLKKINRFFYSFTTFPTFLHHTATDKPKPTFPTTLLHQFSATTKPNFIAIPNKTRSNLTHGNPKPDHFFNSFFTDKPKPTTKPYQFFSLETHNQTHSTQQSNSRQPTHPRRKPIKSQGSQITKLHRNGFRTAPVKNLFLLAMRFLDELLGLQWHEVERERDAPK